jgi:S-(hydroxymethyl)glutathione dehydrogenase / alcohol dehydrogenase
VPEVTAAVWDGVGEPLRLERLRLVDPGHGEVLVRLAASGVCHSDLHIVSGEWLRPVPVVLGHEGAGVVAAVGPGVTTVGVGDHVVLSWTPYCGACPPCLRGRPVLCEVAAATGNLMGADGPRLWRGDIGVRSGAGVGAFAEATVVPASAAIRIRRDVPFEIAAIVGCAVTTGVGAVVNTAAVEPGSDVLVIGCGAVGLSAILGAGLVAAAEIIAVDVIPEKLELARRLGATATIDARTEPVVDRVRAITGGRGVRYAFEAIGRGETIEQAFEATAPGGVTVVVGQVADGVRISIDPYVMSDREKTLTGSNYGSARPPLDFPRLLDWYADGRLTLDPLVARRIPLSDINSAFDDLRAGRSTRTVVIHGTATERGA